VKVGTRLGRYELIEAIGKGGMGEVYLARDSSVGRDVAIKLLPEELVADESRLKRLRLEARLLASLNHPNIAALYGFEEDHGVPFLVLELVAGDTLADRLLRGPLPLGQGLRVGLQVTEALEAAHARGIVHRDLKPSNVMLTPGGTAKLLDFGVARREPHHDTGADTLSEEPHSTGRKLVGTPAYMSPEQLRGFAADQRCDIWAFGCVFYETLAGRHPFPADSSSDVIAAILEHDPDWRALEGCPGKLLDLLKRCLRKDRDHRLHHIADARIEIEEVIAGEPTTPRATASGRWQGGKLLAAVVAAGALVALGSVLGRRNFVAVPSEPVRRFSIELPGKLALGLDYPASVTISQNGRQIAFVADAGGQRLVHVRALDEIAARPLAGTGGAQQPFFSPDGRWLGFFADGKLKKISLRGGAPLTLAAAPHGMGGAWSPEGWIVFAPSRFDGLRRVSEHGGETEVWSRVSLDAGEQAHWNPVLLPDTRTVLFTVWTGGRNTASRLATQAFGQSRHSIVMEGGSDGRFLPPRWLIYGRGAELLATQFDVSTMAIEGTPFRVLEGVQDTPAVGAPVYAVSEQGTLVYAPAATIGYAGRIAWLDAAGRPKEAIEQGNFFGRPRLSPDGTRVAFHFADPDFNVWVKDLARGTRLRLTKDTGWDGFAVWSPDSSRIAFSSAREGSRTLFVQEADGSGVAERLLAPEDPRWPTSWSPDGRWLAFNEEGSRTGMDVWLLDMSERRAHAVLRTDAQEGWARFSPDSQWLAYHSNESGSMEVYVCPVKEPGRRLQVSSGGGATPIWSPAGNRIFYTRGNQLIAVPVRLGRSQDAGRPEALFGIDGLEVNDVSAPGDRFLVVDAPVSISISRLHIVLDWRQVVAELAGR
jgi:eukaryotic-like serine/threonine-protein kinase